MLVLKVNDKELILKYVPKDKQSDALNKLQKGYPVQYLIGNVEFYDCLINVNEDVLIPRFETEYLVDDLLKLLKQYNFNNPKILDIGTGSGCISIALKKNYQCDITAIDINKKAINIAINNAKINNTQINFLNEDIHTFKTNTLFDVIVSNPPYVKIGSNVDEKIKYEPKDAIYAKENGLYFYKLILSKCHNLLNNRNIIALEIGHNQNNEIVSIIKSIYPKAIIISKNDLNNYERYIYVINE